MNIIKIIICLLFHWMPKEGYYIKDGYGYNYPQYHWGCKFCDRTWTTENFR